jgi:hypothetical protein
MAGSVAAPTLARVIAPRRLVVVGALGSLAGQLALLLVGPVVDRAHGGYALTLAAVIWVGFFAAQFVVPIQTFMQHAPPPGMRGQTFAVNNFMNFIFIFLGGVYYLIARLPACDIGPTLAQAGAGVSMVAFLFLVRRDVARITLDAARRR